MSENLNDTKNQQLLNPSNSLKILLCLFIGCLSSVFAEGLSGSEPFWFLNLFKIMVILAIYMLHLLFLLNIAFRTKRTSIPQLYLWGIFFALYESWITKVLWWGYPNEEGGQYGLFFGIGIGEFIVLVFFLHPIVSFITPILIFQLFAVSNQSSKDLNGIIILNHLSFLEHKKRILILFIFLLLLDASFLSVVLGFNILFVLLAIGGNFIIIFILYLICKIKTAKNRIEFSVYSLKLGKIGFSIVIVLLITLYIFSFFIFVPEKLPSSIIPYLIIIIFYIFIGVLIFLTKPSNEVQIEIISSRNFPNIIDLITFFIILTSLATLFCFLQSLGLIALILVHLMMLFSGIIVFLIMLILAFRTK